MTIRKMLAMAICTANYVIVVTDMATQRTWCADTWAEMICKLAHDNMCDAEFKWIDLSPDQIRFVISSAGEMK